jgi:hypothetical protein
VHGVKCKVSYGDDVPLAYAECVSGISFDMISNERAHVVQRFEDDLDGSG